MKYTIEKTLLLTEKNHTVVVRTNQSMLCLLHHVHLKLCLDFAVAHQSYIYIDVHVYDEPWLWLIESGYHWWCCGRVFLQSFIHFSYLFIYFWIVFRLMSAHIYVRVTKYRHVYSWITYMRQVNEMLRCYRHTEKLFGIFICRE